MFNSFFFDIFNNLRIFVEIYWIFIFLEIGLYNKVMIILFYVSNKLGKVCIDFDLILIL